MFGTLATTDAPGERPLGLSPVGACTEVDQALSASIRAYWLHFAATGDPNGSNLPPWPRFTTPSGAHLELGATLTRGDGLHVAGAAIWDHLQTERRATN